MAITSKVKRSAKVYEPRVAPVDNTIVAPPVMTNVDTDKSIATKETQAASATGVNHPWAHLAGKYDDEPAWDDFIEAIQQYRRSLIEQEDAAE